MIPQIYFDKRNLYKGTVFFISSSTNTWDVFKLVSPSFFHAALDCSLPIFVGSNHYEEIEGADVITFAKKCGWRIELANQIAMLPKTVERVILILDDFYFFDKFNEIKLREAIDMHDSSNMDYLRCEPPRRSLVGRALMFFKFRNHPVIHLTNSEPYYSSLQVAIWSRNHLQKMLSMDGNIWEFEWKVIPGSSHYAVKRNLFAYQHLVEKGKWLPESIYHIGSLNNLNAMTKRGYHLIPFFRKNIFTVIKFSIFGYSLMKTKNFYKKHFHSSTNKFS